MAVIDFTTSRWGHTIHAGTFREKRADRLFDRIVDKIKKRRRYTVIVHTSQLINPGDRIVYKTINGNVEAEVADVYWELDPKDMATIEFFRTGP